MKTVEELEISENEITKLEVAEGFVALPYYYNEDEKKRGIATQGFGSTIKPDGTPVKITDEAISRATARLYMLKHITDRTYVDIRRYLPKVQLNQNQFDALCSAVYNLGSQALWNYAPGKPWHNTPTRLTRKIRANPNDPTIREGFMVFDKSNAGLQARRKKEADLYFTPVETA